MLDRRGRERDVVLLENEGALRRCAVDDLAGAAVAADARFRVGLALELDGLAVARAVELALERIGVVVVCASGVKVFGQLAGRHRT